LKLTSKEKVRTLLSFLSDRRNMEIRKSYTQRNLLRIILRIYLLLRISVQGSVLAEELLKGDLKNVPAIL